jgi:uncharacterized protein (TIGR00255 family)
MTGFGSAEGDAGDRRIRVEIRTVNHRWFHLAARLPQELSSAEAELRDLLRRHFERGHVNVQVRWADETPLATQVDLERAGQVVTALRDLQRHYQLGGDVTVEMVARHADVFSTGRVESAAPIAWSAVAPVVTAAAVECREARRREGAELANEVATRLRHIAAGADRVEARIPERLTRERERLTVGVTRLLAGAELDSGRIANEVAVYADRLDITEELVRLRAHLSAASTALAGELPVGKPLGFLAQEIGREINTVGSKANDAEIAHEVVAMKAELEKVREQLENLE